MLLHRRSKMAAAGLSLALAAGTLSLSVLTGVALPTAASATVPAAPAGFTTTWSDDFSGAANTGVPTGSWKYDTGAGDSFGTGEIETMANSTSNVYEDGGGHLVLKALHSGTDPNAGWTSGRIETQAATFGAPAGGVVRMESSIQQPDVTTANGAGYWPAFWMLGSGLRTGGSWPSIGEVDILEDINGRSSVFGTLHCGSNPGGPCNESTGIGSGEHSCAGCQTGYHDYAVEIDRSTSPEQIRYYLDGNNYFTIKASQVDATTWSNAVDHPFFVIYDLAIGGGFPSAFGGGPNSATISGGQLKVDWVAVYNKAPGTVTTTAPSTTGPPSSGETPLSRAGWVAAASSSGGADVPAQAIDGNPATRWSTGTPMVNGQTYTLDMGTAQKFDQASIDAGGSTGDYPRGVTVQVSGDGTSWTSVASVVGTSAKVTVSFGAQTARYLRLVQTGSSSSWWSIAELNVLSAAGTTTPPAGTPVALSRSGWVAAASQSSGDVPANAIDGNPATRFSSGSPMSNGQTFTVDLGAARTFDQVTMDSGGSTQDYARSFTVQIAVDGVTWRNVATGAGTSAVVTARFTNQTARWVRVVQNGSDSSWWSIAEFNLYAG